MKRLSLPYLNKVGSFSNTLNLDLSLSISKQESR